MDLDLLFASLHHLAVFTLVGIIAAEFALLRPGLGGTRLRQLAALDRGYGLAAMVVLVVGFLRVYLAGKGHDYYFANWMFGLKIAAFIGVGLLSIQPTMAILRWSKAARTDAAYVPADAEVRRSRRFLHGEVALLAFIPLFAAAMARGYGS